MQPPTPGLSFRGDQGNWLRLRTLVTLRWAAVAGQLAALTIAERVYGISFPLGACFLVVTAAILANLVAMFVFPENKRLSEPEALLTLLFDVMQLGILLLLTGGLSNPFALLLLVPVSISASALSLRSTLILGAAAILFITLATSVHVPLRLANGSPFAIPPLFEFGYWLAIVIGIIFLGAYARRVATEMRSMSDALLATQMALSREQKLTDLGGVVAAAAHELGTPLATIKLVSSELLDALSDRADLVEDARLIRDQADRCRDILRSMGRAGKDDLHLRRAPLEAVLREAADPHLARGKAVEFSVRPEPGGPDRQPNIRRSPEIIHGLRNLIQNAVDFARTRVWIEAAWSEARLSIRIVDDGEGFSPAVLSRIGDPFVRRRRGKARRASSSTRPAYEGMGLGLFIAKTLLERTGAEVSFANASDPFLTRDERPERSGAVVEVAWPAERLIVTDEGPAGANPTHGP
jgi:two-component system, sensor histidine kinase RegB